MSEFSDDWQSDVPPGARTLRLGSSGEDVRTLQQLLDVPDDGFFGEETARAVEDLQGTLLLPVDGVVGTETWAAVLNGTPFSEVGPRDGGPDAPSPELSRAAAAGVALEALESPGGGRIQDKREPAHEDIVEVVGFRGKPVPLHWLPAQAWGTLVDAARADGIEAPLLEVVSGYRTIARQQVLFAQAIAKYGSEQAARRWVAAPGGSAHHSGRAVDCWLGVANDSSNADEQRTTPAWKWLRLNAERFGFYPYDVEPWHWEYNPPGGLT